MEIIAVALILVSIMLFKYVFKIDFKKAEKLREDKELEKLTDKFPDNVQIAKEMLKMLGNEKVKVEQTANTQTSLYIAILNKISIADIKNNYSRIITIAHECMHSVQDRRLQLFNFIFSNINIIYFIVATILTMTGVIQNTMTQIFILTLFAMIKFAVRGFLEIEAITKSKYLAKEYIESKNLINKKEIESIMEKYDAINKVSLPLTVVQLLTTGLMGVFIYAIIGLAV